MSNFSRSIFFHAAWRNIEWRRLILGRVAACAGIGAFIATYLFMLPAFGVLLTLSFGWIVASLLACATFFIAFSFLNIIWCRV